MAVTAPKTTRVFESPAARQAITRAFLHALGQTIGAHLTLDRLTHAVATRRSFLLTDHQAWLDFTNNLYARLRAVLIEAFTQAANQTLGVKKDVTVGFGPTNPYAIAYANRYAAQLVRDLSQTSQAAIRHILVRVMNGELTVDSAARLIRASIGLTPVQAQALERLRRDLEDKSLNPRSPSFGMTTDRIDATVERQGRAYLAARAAIIARTEAMRAANAGQQAAWQDAARRGTIPQGQVQRMWLTAHDELTCPICAPLDGQLTGLDEPFPGGYEPSFVHPNCRCGQRLVYAQADGSFPSRPPRLHATA